MIPQLSDRAPESPAPPTGRGLLGVPAAAEIRAGVSAAALAALTALALTDSAY